MDPRASRQRSPAEPYVDGSVHDESERPTVADDEALRARQLAAMSRSEQRMDLHALLTDAAWR